MLVIPAIDIKDGKCVRLRQGRMNDETVFSDDPVAMARRWMEAGARRLHIVDLNGAMAGKPVNAAAIQAILSAFPEVPIQVGGGIRDEDTIQAYLEMGVRYVILGTKAVNAPHFVSDACTEFPGHIIVGLDAKDGKVAIDGWSKLSGHDVVDLAQKFLLVQSVWIDSLPSRAQRLPCWALSARSRASRSPSVALAMCSAQPTTSAKSRTPCTA